VGVKDCSFTIHVKRRGGSPRPVWCKQWEIGVPLFLGSSRQKSLKFDPGRRASSRRIYSEPGTGLISWPARGLGRGGVMVKIHGVEVWVTPSPLSGLSDFRVWFSPKNQACRYSRINGERQRYRYGQNDYFYGLPEGTDLRAVIRAALGRRLRYFGGGAYVLRHDRDSACWVLSRRDWRENWNTLARWRYNQYKYRLYHHPRPSRRWIVAVIRANRQCPPGHWLERYHRIGRALATAE